MASIPQNLCVASATTIRLIPDQLVDGSRLGVRLSYVDEPERLGTIGALTLVRPRPLDALLVINADILTKCDFRAMWEFGARRARA